MAPETAKNKRRTVNPIVIMFFFLASSKALMTFLELPVEDVYVSLETTLNIVNPKFESHERLKKIVVLDKEWTIENNLLTPSMKIKRNEVERLYKDNYTTWYEKDGHIVS